MRAPTTCLRADSDASLIVFPAGSTAREEELFDVLDLELDEKLHVDDVLVAGNHEGLFEEGGIAANADFEPTTLPDVDDCAGAYGVRPPPVEARPGRVLEYAEAPERRHLGGFDRIEARREPAEGSDDNHPKNGVYETTASAAKAEPAKMPLIREEICSKFTSGSSCLYIRSRLRPTRVVNS